jgi:hypothetical protein
MLDRQNSRYLNAYESISEARNGLKAYFGFTTMSGVIKVLTERPFMRFARVPSPDTDKTT